MRYALTGDLLIGRIDSTLAASAVNIMSQVRGEDVFSPGCHETIEIDSKVDYYESFNSCSGIELLAFTRAKRRTASLKASFKEATLQSLRAFMNGTDQAADTSSVSVTNHTITPTTGSAALKAGQRYPLGRQNITSLIITANAVPLVAGTSYSLDAPSGVITFLTDVTGPVIATTYSYQNDRGTALFNAPQYDYVVQMANAFNVDGGQKGQFAAYKCKLALDGQFSVTTTEESTINCSGAMQADTSKPNGGLLGQFGFIRGFGFPNAV